MRHRITVNWEMSERRMGMMDDRNIGVSIREKVMPSTQITQYPFSFMFVNP